MKIYVVSRPMLRLLSFYIEMLLVLLTVTATATVFTMNIELGACRCHPGASGDVALHDLLYRYPDPRQTPARFTCSSIGLPEL